MSYAKNCGMKSVQIHHAVWITGDKSLVTCAPEPKPPNSPECISNGRYIEGNIHDFVNWLYFPENPGIFKQRVNGLRRHQKTMGFLCSLLSHALPKSKPIQRLLHSEINGLVLFRQDIIWTNDKPVTAAYMRNQASMS